MKPLIKITAAESQLMDVLWRDAKPQAAEAIREQLSEGWSEATVRTFLTRLVAKKAVGQIKDGRRFLYRPLIERAAYVHGESQGLLDRLFDGQLTPFVSHFAQHGEMTPEEIEQLKALIAKVEKRHG